MHRHFVGRSATRQAYRRSAPRLSLVPRRGSGHPAGATASTRRGRAYVGWSQGVFWPGAFGDIFGYSFSAPAGGETFWAYAYDDIFVGIYWPSSSDQTGSIHPRSRRADAGFATLSPEFARICGNHTPGLTSWPFERIEQTVGPTDAQRVAFDRLKAASAAAIQALRDACPTKTPATPIGRLDALEKRLEAMLAAVDVVRPALQSFYDALNDPQRAQFNAIGAAAARGQGEAVASSVEQRGRSDPAPSCDSERVTGYRERTIRHIEDVVHPAQAQRAALDELRIASSHAAEAMRAACPRNMPATPPGRLDAIEQRLEAMLLAVKTMRPALAKFYDALNDEQKTRFNTMTMQGG